MQTLLSYRRGCNRNYYMFTLMILIKIVLCSEFSWTESINHKSFEMRIVPDAASGDVGVARVSRPWMRVPGLAFEGFGLGV